MAEQNPTVIIAHLDDEKLRKSIDDIVGYVDKQFQSMVSTTTTKVGEMQAKLNELSQIKVDSNGSADGGSSRRAKAIQSEKQSLESLQMSYDKLLGALQMAQRQNRIFAGKDIWTLTREELDKYSATLQRVSELEKSLSAIRGQMSLAMVEKGQFSPNMKEYTDGLVRTSEELKKMGAYYKELEKDAQRAFRVDLVKAMKMPTTTIDEIRAKWVALKMLIEKPSAVGVFTPNQIANAKTQLDDLWGQLSRNRALQEQINADTQQQFFATNQLVEAEQKYGVEIAHTAQYFRESAEGFNQLKLASKGGFFTISNPVYNAEAKSLEEQLLSYKALNQEANLQLEVEKAIAIERQKTAQAAQESAAERQRYNEQRQLEKTNIGEYDQLRATIASVIGIEQNQVRMADIENDSYKALSATLKQLKEAYNSLQSSGRKSETGETIIAEIQAVQRGMQEIQKTMARPVSLDAAFNLPEKTLDQITYKVQMLRSYIQNLDVVEERGDIRKVEDAIERLNQKSKDAQQSTRKIIEDVNKIRFDNISKMPTENIGQIGAKIKEVRQYINDLNAQSVFDEKSLKRAESLLDSLTKKFDKLHKVQGTDSNVNSALRMQANTLNEIAEKTQRLHAIRANLDPTKQADLIQRVNNALRDLGKRQDEILGKNTQMISSNNALARSWNYMKNRLAFYFTVGASTQFVKNLIEVRSQYEMNERALGILIDSAERGTQIFNELSQMALVSPYTLIELSTAAKQLTAYDVAANDVVDTTRRLADMAAAVGIPIERLTYALGQIKAYGYLNSRDARMFLNAGIPLVKNLADHYTELEGKMVSVGDVYDRIKKKAIGYNDVMQVITEMTDEGGKFFDFQAKMADTLKVQLANLTLAWNNMLNEIGKSEQGVLVGGIKGLKELFLQWENINKAIRNVVVTLGLVKAAQLVYYFAVRNSNNAIALHNVLGNKMARNLKEIAVGFRNAKNAITGASTAMKSFVLTTIAIAAIATAVVELAMAWKDAEEGVKDFNKSIRDGATENYKNITNTIEQYKDLRESLYKEEERGGNNVRVAQDIDESNAKKAWESMREEIELSSAASEKYISRLMQIDNVSERLRQGFVLLDDLQAVNSALSEMGDKTIFIQQDWSSWWNLWLAPDSFEENLRDFIKAKKQIEDAYGDIETAREKLGKASSVGDKNLKSGVSRYDNTLEQFRENLKETTDSLIDFISLKGWTGDTNKINELFAQFTNKTVMQLGFDPSEAFTLQLEVEQARAKAAKQSLQIRLEDEKQALKAARDEETKEAIQANIDELQAELNDFDKNNGRGRVLWENYTKWMKEQHMSEMTQMFRDMDAEDIKSINFQEGKWKEFAERTAQQYAKEHKISYNDAFNLLQNWVKNANKWSIFIPLTISTKSGKSVYEQLGEYDKIIDDADSQIKRLTTRIGELQAKQKLSKEEAQELADAQNELAQAERDKADAEAKGGHGKKEAKDAKNAAKEQKQAETELQKALKDELQLLDKVRSQYKKLTDAGVDSNQALTMVTNQFSNSIQRINNILGKNGLPLFNIKAFAGTDNPNAVLEMLKKQLDAAKVAKNIKPEEIKELEVKYGEIVVDAKVYNTKKITDGLNKELSKIKDEYELAVELDANPELGGMFAEMFGIGTNELPQTFGEAFDRANKVAKEKLSELKVDVKDFDLLSTKVKGDNKGMWMGIDVNSDAIKDLIKWQNQYRDILKKNLTETEKALDDYVKKYGDYSDKIAEIEADRIEKVKRLNDAYYSDELRKRPEYIAKLNAIEQGAAREKQQVDFDDFKNSRYYTQMFENLDHVSTKTIRDMRDRVRELIDTMNDLTPEQLKTLMSQYEKLEQKLVKRNPFKTLAKDYKEYLKTRKERKAANKELSDIDKEYNVEKKVLATIKTKLKQAQSADKPNKQNIAYLLEELGIQQEIVDKLKEQLDLAEKKADKYNLIKKLALDEFASTAQMVAGNLQSLGDLRDSLDAMGINLGDDIDAIVDDLGMLGSGINQVVSSAQSGDVIGVAAGAVKAVGGLGDAIASIFGDGAARTKRINREIQRSQESVRQLEMAYKNLQRTVDKEAGTEETRAKREQIANKEAQLAELERQMALEKSKRSKDRDDGAIKQYEETIQDLQLEIAEMKDSIVNDLFGEDVKSAAESFVDAWVEAWQAGETTLDAIQEQMDDMILHLIKKAATTKIVQTLLDPLYKQIDQFTSADSKGGVQLTTDEMKQAADLASKLSIDINEALGVFYGNLENLDVVSKNIDDGDKELSALQQGIQGITEDTAGALEAYMNGVSQQVYLQSGLLTQIRDAVVAMNSDAQLGVQAQMLLQLQQSYAIQVAIQNILAGWSNPSGLAVRVEMV